MQSLVRFLNTIKKVVFDRLQFLKLQELQLSEQTIGEFDHYFETYILNGVGEWIPYHSSVPKYLFLNYLVETKNVLVHGSNLPDIICFEPREQLLFNGKPIKAVFAVSDGVWSIFFAIINRKDYIGSLRNACITVPTKKGIRRYYYFSINKDFLGNHWTEGTIYLLPKESFQQGGIKDEWICKQEVKPLAKLRVTPKDFPFIDKVNLHNEKDSLLKTLIKTLILKRF